MAPSSTASSSCLSMPWVPQSDDILVLVMGLTGSGKSTFINSAANAERTAVGRGLEPCTKKICAVPAADPGDRTRRLVLIDTPGLDNPEVEDTAILESISEWLVTTYTSETLLSGIIYLHEINQARMRGSFPKNYEMLEKLCGHKMTANVVLATTKWAQISEEEGATREERLKEKFWAFMPNQASGPARFMDNTNSAWDIVNLLIPRGRLPQLISSSPGKASSSRLPTLGRPSSSWVPQASDILILIMGPTGSGKSTFINAAAGAECTLVGHQLDSCTTEIKAVAVDCPGDRDTRVIFIDTPGFDDTAMEDNEILQKISEWLVEMYRRETKLAGILYLHEIPQARMGRRFLNNYDMFIELCGDDALANIVLVTTKWAHILPADGEASEQQLKNEYWSSVLAQGAVARRFMDTHKSAWDIVDLIIPKARLRVLQIQRELVDQGKTLPQTSASIALHQHSQNMFGRLKDAFSRLTSFLGV